MWGSEGVGDCMEVLECTCVRCTGSVDVWSYEELETMWRF